MIPTQEDIDKYWADMAEELSKQVWSDEENMERARSSQVYRYPSNPDGNTLCGKLGRPHLFKRHSCYDTSCIHPGCDGCI